MIKFFYLQLNELFSIYINSYLTIYFLTYDSVKGGDFTKTTVSVLEIEPIRHIVTLT